MRKVDIRRRLAFESWFTSHIENAKQSRYFQELRETTVERVKRQTNPQPLPDKTPIVQNINLALYPKETVYEFVFPQELIPLWRDSSRERFADDGSLRAGIAYYMLWQRLENPYAWNEIGLISGDNARILGMLEKRHYDYSKEVEKVMSKVEKKQVIVYGAPGTGKSFLFKNEVGSNKSFRTTFHPDSDYSTFVGAYKPTMKNDKIAYEFRSQVFLEAYFKAWRYLSVATSEIGAKPVFLIIEEINRGNCAQIFGDLFQLLDRGDMGYSSYPIDADRDLCDCVSRHIGSLTFVDADKRSVINDMFEDSEDIVSDILAGRKLVLPPNLYIWATMNTSDQSLFPMDSAFKRRWEWQYVPISKPDKEGDPTWKERKIKVGEATYDWWTFLTIINKHIAKATESEDKQLGYFFVKAPDDTGLITAEQFANKVLFYLYGDVFKSYDLPAAVFKRESGAKWEFRDFFYSETSVVLKADGTIVKDADGNVLKTVTDEATQMLKKPGDVNEFELAAFLAHLKWTDASGKALELKSEPGADA